MHTSVTVFKTLATSTQVLPRKQALVRISTYLLCIPMSTHQSCFWLQLWKPSNHACWRVIHGLTHTHSRVLSRPRQLHIWLKSYCCTRSILYVDNFTTFHNKTDLFTWSIPPKSQIVDSRQLPMNTEFSPLIPKFSSQDRLYVLSPCPSPWDLNLMQVTRLQITWGEIYVGSCSANLYICSSFIVCKL